MQHDRLPFPEAVEALARHAGMEVPQNSGTPQKKDESLPALYDLMTKATTYYYEQMRKSERAINYLKNRGISGVIAQQFSLGYAPTGWSHLLDALSNDETDKKKLLDSGLIIKKNEGGYYDRFRDRIMFPIHDYRGRLIGFGGRIIDQGEPKYLNSPETPLFQKGHELYGLYQAIKSNRTLERVLVVEGYMDVIALFQHDITYAVATLGTATTHHHLQRLSRYTSDIIFCFDGDEAGRTAAWRSVQVIFPLMNDSLQVRFLFLPDGEDPDSLIRKEGKQEFEKRMDSALSLASFFFQTLAKQSDMNTMEGRARFAASALHSIKTLPGGIFQEILLEELSKRARVELSSLKQQIKTTPEAQIVITPPILAPEPKINLAPQLRKALALVVQYPSLAQSIDPTFPAVNLPGHNFLLQLVEIVQKNPNITTGGLIEYWRGQKEGPFIAKLAQYEHSIPEKGLKNEFLGTLRQLVGLGFDTEIDRLMAKAAHDGLSEGEKVELSGWIAKKKAWLAPQP